MVCLDVPFPADYGGAIDMYYRIQALKELGFELKLHIFEYGRGRHKELEAFGDVFYYKRKRSIWQVFSKRPFIVQSRKNKQLLERLLKDKAPIFFEGIHTTWYLEHLEIQKRTTLVRMHNIEHEYYSGLGRQSSFLKKLFFQLEASKLKNYQSILSNCSAVLAIKEEEADRLRVLNPNVHVLPASLPRIEGQFVPTKRYVLFHGHLAVPENTQAATYLIKNLSGVINKEFSLIIAGKNPPRNLRKLCYLNDISLIADPSTKKMDQLIQEAHIHVLYTENSSGIKLKLLSCLYSSGHVLVNPKMVQGTPLSDLCTIYEDAKDLKMHFLGLRNSSLNKEEFEKRKTYIQKLFNTNKNCDLIRVILDRESPDDESVN
jgi:hypothetical protein